jgi:predicted Zn-dependent protease with MMP-like domain
MTQVNQDRELAVIEEIYAALDEGAPERAYELARGGLADLPDDDPVLRFLAGRALLELDRPAEAVAELRRAVALDAEDAEFRTDLAEALFLSCDFDEARVQARQAVGLDPTLADAHHVLALALERSGDLRGAEQHFRKATRLDGERFPEAYRVDWDEFERQLSRARAQLPAAFARHLEEVDVIVEELPPLELLAEESPPLCPELLGLFTGTTIESRDSPAALGALPPRIYLFKRNLERSVVSSDELAEQIRVTLFHELGHYLGLDEGDLEQAGYA